MADVTGGAGPGDRNEPGGFIRYIAVADREHARIYLEERTAGQPQAALRLADAADFPAGHASYSERNTDVAGRFPSPAGRHRGGGIDERLPMREEERRRNWADVADFLNAFFRDRGGVSWDLAVARPSYERVLERLDPTARSRLRRTLAKDLVKEPAESLRSHFDHS